VAKRHRGEEGLKAVRIFGPTQKAGQ